MAKCLCLLTHMKTRVLITWHFRIKPTNPLKWPLSYGSEETNKIRLQTTEMLHRNWWSWVACWTTSCFSRERRQWSNSCYRTRLFPDPFKYDPLESEAGDSALSEKKRAIKLKQWGILRAARVSSTRNMWAGTYFEMFWKQCLSLAWLWKGPWDIFSNINWNFIRLWGGDKHIKENHQPHLLFCLDWWNYISVHAITNQIRIINNILCCLLFKNKWAHTIASLPKATVNVSLESRTLIKGHLVINKAFRKTPFWWTWTIILTENSI